MEREGQLLTFKQAFICIPYAAGMFTNNAKSIRQGNCTSHGEIKRRDCPPHSALSLNPPAFLISCAFYEAQGQTSRAPCNPSSVQLQLFVLAFPLSQTKTKQWSEKPQRFTSY